MSSRILLAIAVALVGLTASTSASAACVAPLDASDALTNDDRAAAMRLFEFELRTAVGTLEAWPCDQAWSVQHIAVAGQHQAMILSPDGGRRLPFEDLASLAAAYTVAIRGLTAPDASAEATLVEPDAGLTTLFHLRFIGAMHINAEADAELDPGFGFGVRLLSGRAGLDVSALNLTFDEGEPSGDWVRLMPMVHFVRPDRVGAMQGFAGVGLGWSTVRYEDPDADVKATADGVELDLVVGWSFMEHLPVKPFIQFEVGLPLFEVDYEQVTPTGTRAADAWTPNVGLSIGFGSRI